jgi:hypothetical protein
MNLEPFRFNPLAAWEKLIIVLEFACYFLYGGERIHVKYIHLSDN